MIDKERLKDMEDEYLRITPPDSTSALEQFRDTFIRFYLEGHSRQSTFEFLDSRKLIACSKATFYRWLAANVDFRQEGADYLARSRGMEVSHANPEGVASNRAAATDSHADGGSSAAAIPSPSDIGSANLPLKSTYPLTFRPTLGVESGGGDRAQRLSALDAVLDDVAASSHEAVAARALSRLASRVGPRESWGSAIREGQQ
jgi:hypothetical protein